MKLKSIFSNKSVYKQIDNRWSQLKLLNPFTPRQAFAFCSQGDIGYIHGGYNCDQGILSDMYMAKFNDIDDRNWYKIQEKGKNIPGKLRYHTLSSGQKMQNINNNQIFVFNLKTQAWAKLNITYQDSQHKIQEIKDLLSRDSHCSIVNGKYLYMFGGYVSNLGEYSNQILRLNLSKIETGHDNVQLPPPRANFAACAFNGHMYIFGGTNSVDFYDDFWRFDFEKQTWENLTLPQDGRFYWPQKRKGAVLVSYPQSKSLILFGGMQTITKQQNDLSIYLVQKKQWVKVHSNTNNIYDPSPTIKQQHQDSPTIISHKSKRVQKPEFRIGFVNPNANHPHHNPFNSFNSHNLESSNTHNIHNSSNDLNSGHQKNEKPLFRSKSIKESKEKTKSQFNQKVCQTQHTSFYKHPSKQVKTQSNFYSKKQSLHKMSVVQQKKHRQFLARKKRLLSEVYASYKQEKIKRPFSPTSQCLNYTLHQLGQQHQFFQSKNPQFQLPKVIFDDKKFQVIGKKPCARDGHAAFSYDKKMFIIGGDRHMISFNDTHLLRLDKAIQSISYYS